MKARPCPERCGSDPLCLLCAGHDRWVVNEEQLVDVFVDVAHLVLNPLTARERARNVVSVLILEDVDPDAPEWEPLIVTMLGRARLPHLGGNTEVTDDELREVARRVAAYVRGEDLHPEPVRPSSSTTTRASTAPSAAPPSSASSESSARSREAATGPGTNGAGDGPPPVADADRRCLTVNGSPSLSTASVMEEGAHDGG